jgi:hypothetical protein
MHRILFILLFFIFTSCSKNKEVKHTILEEHKTTTWVLLKERIYKEEITEIAEEFISEPKNKNKVSICFFLNNKRKHETAFAIVYFLNSKIHKVIYEYDEEKYNQFFSLKFNENILNHWELKYSSRPSQTFIYKKDNQLFYKSLMIDFYSDKLYYEYLQPLINIDSLESKEIKFQLKNNDSLRYYLIDKDKNLKTFYKNKLTDIIYPKTR